MKANGYTVIELVITMALMAILSTVGWMQYSRSVTKGTVETETRQLMSDLLKARSDALYQRRPRSVVIAGSGLQYSIYSSVVTSVKPLSLVSVKYPFVASGVTPLTFDEQGTLMNDPSNTGSCVCVSAGSNDSAVDSLVLTKLRMQIGKWNVPGGSSSACSANNITR
jgi:prepilin-type N-terminal cleavage/methylation domain-containing protein